MSDKKIVLILVFFIPFMSFSELIKTSKISEVKNSDMKISRNIFSPRKTNVTVRSGNFKKISRVNKMEQKKKEETVEDKVIATVFYEGFLLKGGRKYALLKVNGRYYISGEGENIPGTILLKKILEKKIVLEIEASEVVITKKGERNVN